MALLNTMEEGVRRERERELLPCLCLAGTLCLYVCLLLCERGEGGGSFVPLPLSIEVERK